MSGPKWTPGPWQALMPVSWLILLSRASRSIAHDHRIIGPRARLIAAAPDLYDALRRLLATINPGNADTHAAGCSCVIHEARRALAKARGEQ